jgi:hypothetical protein
MARRDPGGEAGGKRILEQRSDRAGYRRPKNRFRCENQKIRTGVIYVRLCDPNTLAGPIPPIARRSNWPVTLWMGCESERCQGSVAVG